MRGRRRSSSPRPRPPRSARCRGGRRAHRARTRSRSGCWARSPARSRRSATTSCTGRSSSPAHWNKTHKLQLTIVQGDTQLDPAKASVVAQSMASNSSIVGVIGPAGSQEVTAVAPILKKAGLAFISGSATNVVADGRQAQGLLLPRRPERRRPGPDGGDYMMPAPRRQEGHEGHDRRRPGVVLDRASPTSSAACSRRPASRSTASRSARRRPTSRRSSPRSASSTKVVFLPFQLASQAQLFAQQLKSQGKSAIVVRQRRHVRLVEVQRQRELRLVLRSRRDDDRGQQGDRRRVQQGVPGRHEPVRRPELRRRAALRDGRDGWRARTARSPAPSSARRVAKVKLASTILGGPMSFTANGDVSGAKFLVFKIADGKYTTVS